jgi:hypothetical protein
MLHLHSLKDISLDSVSLPSTGTTATSVTRKSRVPSSSDSSIVPSKLRMLCQAFGRTQTHVKGHCSRLYYYQEQYLGIDSMKLQRLDLAPLLAMGRKVWL